MTSWTLKTSKSAPSDAANKPPYQAAAASGLTYDDTNVSKFPTVQSLVNFLQKEEGTGRQWSADNGAGTIVLPYHTSNT